MNLIDYYNTIPVSYINCSKERQGYNNNIFVFIIHTNHELSINKLNNNNIPHDISNYKRLIFKYKTTCFEISSFTGSIFISEAGLATICIYTNSFSKYHCE